MTGNKTSLFGGRIRRLGAVLAILFTVAARLSAQQVSDCEQHADLDRQIAACSLIIQLIQQGKADAKILAIAYGHRGEAYHLKREYERAIADFGNAIKTDPKYAWAYTGRAMAYQKMREHRQAVQDFDAAIILNPKDAEAYCRRGWSKGVLAVRDHNIKVDHIVQDLLNGLLIDPKSATCQQGMKQFAR